MIYLFLLLMFVQEYIPPGSEQFEKPAKEEYAIAKWLRKNVPTKKTKFLNHNVEYFTGKFKKKS